MAGFKDLEGRYGSRSFGIDSFKKDDESSPLSTSRSAQLIQDLPVTRDVAPVDRNPERELEQSISTKVLSAQKQDKLRTGMAETLYNLEDEGTLAGISAGWHSGRYNAILDQAIMDAAELGDTESIKAINEWKNEFNQTKASMVEAGDPNAVQKALYQAAESAPYMVKIGLSMGASKVTAGVTGKIINSQISRETQRQMASLAFKSVIGKEGKERFAMKMFAPALTKAVARMTASDLLLTSAQGAAASTGVGAIPAVAAEVLQWAVIGGMLVWDAIQITRTLSKDEETGLLEAKKLPFLISPNGVGAMAAAKQMAGAHYSAQINAGIDPKFINKEAANAVGLLQGAIESVFNPFQIVSPATAVANKAFGKLFTSAAAQQGSNTLRLLGIVGKPLVVGGSRAIGEMEEEGAQAVVGQYYLSKQARAYIEKHPEVATTSAVYANLASIADTNARDMVELFATEAKAAGPVSIVFAMMGLPMYGLNLITNENAPEVQTQLEKQAEEAVADLDIQGLYDLMNETRAKYSNMREWSYEDVAKVRAAAVKLEETAREENNTDALDRARNMIVMLDRAELQGDVVAFFKEEKMGAEAQSILIPNEVTEAEAKALWQQIKARRKKNNRKSVTFDAFKELIYGKDFEFKTEAAQETSASTIKAVELLRKSVKDGTKPYGIRRKVFEVYEEKILLDDAMTDEELLTAIDEYEAGLTEQTVTAEQRAQEQATQQEQMQARQAAETAVAENIQLSDNAKQNITLEAFKEKYYPRVKDTGLSVEEAFSLATGRQIQAEQAQAKKEDRAATVQRAATEGMTVPEATALAKTEEGQAILAEAFPDVGIDTEIDTAATIIQKLKDAKKIGSLRVRKAARGENVQPVDQAEEVRRATRYDQVAQEAEQTTGEQQQAAQAVLNELRTNESEEARQAAFEAYREQYPALEPQEEQKAAPAPKTAAEKASEPALADSITANEEILTNPESNQDEISTARKNLIKDYKKLAQEIVKKQIGAEGQVATDLLVEKAEVDIERLNFEREVATETLEGEALDKRFASIDKQIAQKQRQIAAAQGVVQQQAAPIKKKEVVKEEPKPLSDQLIENLTATEEDAVTADALRNLTRRDDVQQKDDIKEIAQIAQALGEGQGRQLDELTEQEQETVGLLVIGKVDGQRVHARVDMSTSGRVVSEIPPQFLDENGNLKKSVVVRRVLVGRKYIYDDGTSDSHTIVSGMQAIQLWDAASSAQAYNIALISPTGEGFPARRAEGTAKLVGTTALGFQSENDYIVLNMKEATKRTEQMVRAAGLLQGERKNVNDLKQRALNSTQRKIKKRRDVIAELEQQELGKVLAELKTVTRRAKRSTVKKTVNAALKRQKQLEKEAAAIRRKIQKEYTAILDEITAYKTKAAEIESNNINLTDEEIQDIFLKQKDDDGKQRSVTMRKLAFMIWHGNRNESLRSSYEMSVGEDLGLYENGARDVNAESLLAEVIQDAVMEEMAGQKTGALLRYLQDRPNIREDAVFKELSRRMKRAAVKAIGEVKGEKAIQNSIQALRSMDTDSRIEVSSRLRALLNDPNLFVDVAATQKQIIALRRRLKQSKKAETVSARQAEIAALEKQIEGVDQNRREREVLTGLLEVMLDKYGILKQDWEAFTSSDIRERQSSTIYKAMVGDGYVQGIFDILESDTKEVTGTAWRMLENIYGVDTSVFGTEEGGRTKKQALVETLAENNTEKFRRLLETNPSFRQPSNIRPMKSNGSVGSQKQLDLLVGEDVAIEQQIKDAATIVAIKDEIAKSEAKIANVEEIAATAVQRIKNAAAKLEAIKQDENATEKQIAYAEKKLENARTRLAREKRADAARVKKVPELRARLKQLQAKTPQSIQQRVALDLLQYRAEARLYSAQRKLTNAMLNSILSPDSPFRREGDTSFQQREETSREPLPDAVAMENDVTFTKEVIGAVRTLETALTQRVLLGNNINQAENIKALNTVEAEIKRRLADPTIEKKEALSPEDRAQLEASRDAIVSRLSQIERENANKGTSPDRIAQNEEQDERLRQRLDQINNTLAAPTGKNAAIIDTERMMNLAKVSRQRIEDAQMIDNGRAVNGRKEFTGFDTAEEASTKAQELRQNTAERLREARGAEYADANARLDGDYSTQNIDAKINDIYAELKAEKEKGPISPEKWRSYQRQINALRSIATAHPVRKVGERYGIFESDSVSAARQFQEFMENEYLSEEEYKAAVKAEADRFGMTMVEEGDGYTLTTKNGKRLHISYRSELFNDEENQVDPKAGITEGDIIKIAGLGANIGTVKHELAEWAFNALLNDSERAVIIKVYKSSHGWANAMQNYTPSNSDIGRRTNVIMNKVRNFFRGIIGLPPKQVDEFAWYAEIADDINQQYQTGALHKEIRDVKDTTRISGLNTRAELEAMSRSELQAAFRARRAYMRKIGVELSVTEEASTERLIYNLSRPDHYMVHALNSMAETATGRKAIALLTNPILSSQMSPAARLEIVGQFDPTGIVNEVVNNIKSAEANKVAPIRDRLESYMRNTFPAKEANAHYDVTVGGKKVKINGHTAISIVVAASNPSVRKQMLQNKLSFRTVAVGRLTNKAISDKPITEQELADIKAQLPSADSVLEQWRYMTDDISRNAGPLVNQLVALNEKKNGKTKKIRNYLSLTKEWVHEPSWYPTIWGKDLAPFGSSIGEIMTAKEPWMSAKEAQRTGRTLVIPDINEVTASHAQSAARFMGMALELQNLSNTLYGVSKTGKFFNAEAMKNWDEVKRERMVDALGKAFEQTVQAGRKAQGFTKHPLFKFLKAGQDLYRLSSPVTMLRMASSSHLAMPLLTDPKNMLRAYKTPKFSQTLTKRFQLNSYQYSRGEQTVVPDVGDTNTRTKGRSILQGTGGVRTTIRSLPAQADRVAMKNIFLASAFDVLTEQGFAPTMSEIEKRSNDSAFWSAVNNKANRLTMETQPTFESFMRSDLLNRGDFVSIIITRYGTQRNRMLNMLATSYANAQANDGPVARKQFERVAMSVLGTNALVMAAIAASDQMFKGVVLNSIRGEDDDDMLYAFERKRDASGRPTSQATGRRVATAAGTALVSTPLTLLEGGDEAFRLIQGVYGAVTGDKGLQDRATQGQFAYGEIKAVLDAVSSAASLARQKQNMREARTMGEYMTAKRSYAYNAGKLYQSLSQVVGVGLHLPTRMLDYGINPRERIRKAAFE